MKKFSKFVFRTIKGIYDILATYLLLFLVPFCAASVVIWLLTGQAATFFEFESRDAMWSLVSGKLGLPDTWIRLAAVLPIHLSIWWLLRRPVAMALPFLEAGFDKVVSAFKWATSRAVWIRTAVEILFSIVVTAVLIPFVIQPTLVPGFGPQSWVERAANFTDGTASAEIADSNGAIFIILVTGQKLFSPVARLVQCYTKANLGRFISHSEAWTGCQKIWPGCQKASVK